MLGKLSHPGWPVEMDESQRRREPESRGEEMRPVENPARTSVGCLERFRHFNPGGPTEIAEIAVIGKTQQKIKPTWW